MSSHLCLLPHSSILSTLIPIYPLSRLCRGPKHLNLASLTMSPTSNQGCLSDVLISNPVNPCPSLSLSKRISKCLTPLPPSSSASCPLDRATISKPNSTAGLTTFLLTFRVTLPTTLLLKINLTVPLAICLAMTHRSEYHLQTSSSTDIPARPNLLVCPLPQQTRRGSGLILNSVPTPPWRHPSFPQHTSPLSYCSHTYLVQVKHSSL